MNQNEVLHNTYYDKTKKIKDSENALTTTALTELYKENLKL